MYLVLVGFGDRDMEVSQEEIVSRLSWNREKSRVEDTLGRGGQREVTHTININDKEQRTKDGALWNSGG